MCRSLLPKSASFSFVHSIIWLVGDDYEICRTPLSFIPCFLALVGRSGWQWGRWVVSRTGEGRRLQRFYGKAPTWLRFRRRSPQEEEQACLECFPASRLLVVSYLPCISLFCCFEYPSPSPATMAVGFRHLTTTLLGGCSYPYSNTMYFMSNGLMGSDASLYIYQRFI